MNTNNSDIELQELAFAELGLAIFIRAFSDYKGRIDRGEGDPRTLQETARKFLFGETEDWKTSRDFWLRVSGISNEFFDSVLLPKLSQISDESDSSLTKLEDLQLNIHTRRAALKK